MTQNTIQFYDGFFPQLKAGDYSIQLDHTVTGGPSGAPDWSVPQPFTVAGPQFTIDPSAVVSAYPPAGSTGDYDHVLPFIVLSDPSLPWERSLVPGADLPGTGDPTPWVALVVLRESDLVLPVGANDAVTSGEVGTLLQTTDTVLAPSVTPSDPTVVAQTITIAGSQFAAVMPTSDDLVHLAHCRQLATTGEPPGMNAVVVANRLAQSAAGDTTYHAHLVSLEGLSAAITPGAQLPDKTGAGQSGPKDVILVSLASWTFTSTAEGAPFSGLIAGLVQSQTETPALALPVPAGVTPPPAVATRLAGGYVPLSYGLPSGETTFAWYRGPLTPQPAQPLPATSTTSSDALLVYSASEGVFDVSYAVAWQLGRSLGLADGTFTQALSRYRQAARSAGAQLGQLRTVPMLADMGPADLLAPNPARRRLIGALTEGLGERWTETLRAGPRAGARAVTGRLHAAAPHRGRRAVAAALQGSAGAALSSALSDAQAPIALWLANLALLIPVPFTNLVSDEAMLPAESVRLFYVDAGWQQAVAAGAMSIGIQSSADIALDATLKPALDAAVAADLAALGATGAPMSGLLIRSALVPAWPTLVVTASAGGLPLPTIRRDTLTTDVLLCLWSGVPDTVTLSEPYQGLRFGVEDNGVSLRDVTTPGSIGRQLSQTVPVPSVDGRINVAGLAATIAGALHVPAIGAGDLAIQLVLAPERQAFPTEGAS